MALFSTFQFFLLVIFSVAGIAYAKLGIVEPFPVTIYPIEHSTAQVTCVAYDVDGQEMPAQIVFVKGDDFGNEKNLTDDSKFRLTNRTEENGRKLIATVHFLNVTMADDSSDGYYQCRVYAVGQSNISSKDLPTKQKRVFNIKVVKVSDIPRVTVSKVKNLQHDDTVTIFCNLTYKGINAGLKSITWFKDGVNLTDTTTNVKTKESFPLVVKNIGIKDAGTYSCILEVLLKNKRPYNVTDSSLLTIAPWFEDKDTKEVGKKLGENVTLECGARGFSLNVEWKFKNETAEIYKSCINSSTNDRYKVTHKGAYDPYYLTVINLGRADFGVYYCCLPSNCSVDINEDQCQRFELLVGGDTTAGTMSVASHNVFLILAFFLVSLLCR